MDKSAGTTRSDQQNRQVHVICEMPLHHTLGGHELIPAAQVGNHNKR